jgi:hypothetical protein
MKRFGRDGRMGGWVALGVLKPVESPSERRR